MGDCEYKEQCPFYNDKMSNVSDKAESLKEKYCRNNNLNCARYMIINSLGFDNMPEDLLPDEKQRAYLHIAENS